MKMRIMRNLVLLRILMYEYFQVFVRKKFLTLCTYSEHFKQTIDFGNLDLNGEIDFGEEVSLDAGGDIDWGDAAEQPAGEETDYNVDISWEESGIVVEAAGQEGGMAVGTEAYTILDNPTTRSEFINQLFEV